ncbi:MAG: PAS domain S-box protein [Pseudomonadota bacterium]
MKLSTRISGLVVGVTLVFGLMIPWLLGERLDEHVDLTQDRLVRSLTLFVGEGVARSVLDGEVLATRQILRNIVHEGVELDYAYVLDFDGRLFAHSFDKGFPLDLLTLQHVTDGALRSARFLSGNRLITDIAYPLISGLDAELHLGVNRDMEEQLTRVIWFDLLLLSLLIAVFGLLFALWSGKRLSRPLEQLARQMRDYGANKLFEPGILDSDDIEAQKLFNSFNSMIEERRQLDVRLLESERYNRTLFETTPIGLALTSLDGRFVDVNPAFAAIIGRTLEETLAISYWDITPKDYYALEQQQLDQLMQTGGYGPSEKEYIHLDGHLVPVRLQGLIIEKDGERFIWSSVEDISDIKVVEQELLEYRQHLEELVAERTAKLRQQARIIDQIHDAVITTDLPGVITSWNGGAERLFGLSAKAAIGQQIARLYPPEEHDFLGHQIIEPLKRKGRHEVEVRLCRADGSIFDASLSLSLLYDDNQVPIGMIGYSVDISERKRAEARLRMLTDELTAANSELEAFTRSVSHDLRAPLRAMDGFSQALLEDYGDELDDTAHDYLLRVRKAAQFMGQLIDELLKLSRVSRLELVWEMVDLSDLAEPIIQQLRKADPSRRVRVSIASGLKVMGDPGLLRIVMVNLLDNAWKYTSRIKNARIEVGSLIEEDQRFIFVRDNGAGFNMDYAAKLFGVFQRLHHKDEFPGNGIGLATVQRIIKRHGGSIRAEARVGKGATFYFLLGQTGSDRNQQQEKQMRKK